MNQETILRASPPPLHTVFRDTIAPTQSSENTIDKTTIEEFLCLSKVFLGLDNKS